MDFSIEVPTDVELNYGVLAYYEGVLTLAHAYPMIAVYDQGGWNAEIPPQSGDVTFADASFFLVSVTAPKGVTIVASGVESEPVTSGRQVVQNVMIGPARDFFLAVSKDFDVVSKTVGGVAVNSYAPKKWRDVSQSMIDTAFRAIETFSNQFSPYPYTEFDIVATPNLALGIEYPGVTAITFRLYTDEAFGTQSDVYRESTVAHEVGHQWFYNMVGNDQLDEPWLDESLTQFVTWEYFRLEGGAPAASGFESSLRGRWSRVDNAPIAIGQPVAAYTSTQYSAIIYGRGALFFEALREEMGKAAFEAFMKEYVKTFSWQIATTDGLKSLAEANCSCDLTPLFEEWIYP
jgi:aminopeptidase N